MIWWVICENRLRIGFRNEFLTFTSENEVDLDELHILKITFRNGLAIGMGNFPQHFPQNFLQDFLQDFPARFSCKIFPQDFPARFSYKNFPQDFPARIFRKNFLQEFPTRFSCKNFPQEFPARFPHKLSRKIFPQDFPAKFSCKIPLSWILIGWLPITLFQMLNFHQSLPFLNWLFPLLAPQEFPARICHKIFMQDFPTRFS